VQRLVIWDVGGLEPDEIEALETWVAEGGMALLGGQMEGFDGWLPTGREGIARPVAPHPATAGIQSVSVGYGRFRTTFEDRLVHLKDDFGQPVLVSWRVGRGRIFWSADTEWLSNARIREAQNLELALQVLLPPGGQVAFDEYHHGFTSPWWRILRGPLQASGLLMAASVALLFWSYGARFGSPLPAPERPPRAAVEYVHSMSRLYRRAGARAVVLRALHKALRTQLSRLTGGAEGLSHAEIARRAAARCGVPPEDIERLLDRTANLSHPPADAELIELARKAENLRRRIEHAGYRDG